MSVYIDPSTDNFVRQANGALQQPESELLQAMHVRLKTHRGSVLWDLSFGSRLHTLRTIVSAERDADAYIREALQPLVDVGELTDLQVSVVRTTRSRIDFTASGKDAGRRPVSFNTWVSLL